MKFKAVVVSLLLGCSNLAVALVPQGAVPKGRIEGTILKSGSNDPLAGVRVNVIRVSNTGPIASGGVVSMSVSAVGPPPAPPPNRAGTAPTALPPIPLPAIPSVVTDREGKFLIPDLDEGSYRLALIAPGYVRQEYGQRVFPGQGTVLTLTPGQVMKDLDVRLTLAGNISGRLRDSFGQPASGVPVQLLKPAYNASGQKSFQQAGQTRTNDRGEYRIYWVTPGRYYVAAGSPPGPGGGMGAGVVSTPNDPGDSYLFSYYPGVTDLAAANSVEVSSGNEATADFLIPRQQTYLVRGRVVDASTNQPPPSISLSLSFAMITGGGATWTMGSPYTGSSGTFEIRDLIPGSYTLQVSSSQGSVARLPLEVTNNIEGFPVVLNTAAALPGRLVIDGLDQTGVERLRVQLRPANNAGIGSVSAVVSADGAFKLENLVPGEYRVGISGSADYFIKEARFERNDVLNEPMKVAGGTSGGTSLDVVVSNKSGQIDGVVTDQKLQPVAGVQAVLVPEKYRDRTELFKTAQTDQTGRFTIRGIAPGDYKVFSWESLENFAYFDPDVLKHADALGKPIRITESARAQVDVRVIPAK